MLLNDLQREADEVLELVLNYPEFDSTIDPEDIEKLQSAWMQEKQSLLAAIKALKQLVSKTSQAVTVCFEIFLIFLSGAIFSF